jgi:tyrosyl-tRNA synthetase
MLDHDAIFEIYQIIMKKETTDFDKFMDLQTKYGITNIEDLCRNFDDEDIFEYVSHRLASILRNVYAFQEYIAYCKQARATYRGQLLKEKQENENKKTL